nr:MAG TPA: hypothetical protein [Caudoviricetes sp.]
MVCQRHSRANFANGNKKKGQTVKPAVLKTTTDVFQVRIRR